MRWASPPESVGGRRGRASGSRGRRRPGTAGGCAISRTSSPAIFLLVGGRASSSLKCASSSPSGVRQISSSVRSRNRTAAASSRRRLPPQVEHSTSPTRCSQLAAQGRREPRGFFERRVEALVLEAEQRPRRSSCACRRRRRRSTLRPCRGGRSGGAWRRAGRTARRAARRRAPTAPRASAETAALSAAGQRPTAPCGQRQLRIAQQGGRVGAGLRAQALRRPGTSRASC